MPWQEWFSDFKVPREILRLVDAGLLVDSTQRQDTSPNFNAVLSDGSILTFWVEHPMAGKRIGQFKRFGITLAAPGESSQPLLETDKLGVAMEALRSILRSEGGPRMAGPMMGASEGGWWVPAWHLVES